MAGDARWTKKVSVKFVGDADVVQNIIHIKESQKGALNKHEKNVSIPLQDIEDTHVENEYYTPTEIVENNGLAGGEVYAFTSRSSRKIRNVPEKTESDESDVDDAEFCSISDDAEEQTKVVSEKKKNTQSKEKSKKNQADTDEYFYAHGQSKSRTSDNTLSKLECPFNDLESLRQILNNVPDAHVNEKKKLLSDHSKLFNKWLFVLSEGFNIVLYGLGSKIPLLEMFCKDVLNNCNYIVVHGFFPGLTIKQILNSITEAIDHEGSFQSIADHVDFIRQHFDELGTEDLYLIIHNIDGTILRLEKNQSVLSCIAQAHHIHIIASVDHINSPLIWDQTKLSQFNWLWFDATTLSSYTAETAYENSLLVQKSGSLLLSSLLHVFHSLTPNAKGIFLILVRWQLDHRDKGNVGLSFQEYYQQCREAFLVNSDLTMRAQLREFLDHKLLRSHKSTDGVEWLHIPLDNSTLSQFMELQESE